MHPFVGRRLPRLGDAALLTGRARYVGDLLPRGTRHVVVVRSTIAHGTVRSVHFDAEPPGDAQLVGPELFARRAASLRVVWRLGDQQQVATPLYDGGVRYVGQPVALVVSGDEATAIDAAQLVRVDLDPRPVVANVDAALAPDAGLLWRDLPSNVLCRVDAGDDDDHVDGVLAGCDHVLRASLTVGRLAAASMEPRGILVEPDGDRLVVHTSTQSPHAVRDAIAEVTGWTLDRVRVVAPTVGGAFGSKDHAYEDELMVVIAAVALRCPLRWIESRAESLTVTAQARDERHDAEIGFDDDGRLRALRVRALRDGGAHLSIFGGGPLFAGLGMLPGPYRWEAYRGEGRVVATNRVPTAAYRGFGQTQAAFVRERLVDMVAASLGRDPVELRLANVVDAAEQPWTARSHITYDNGDYARSLRRARVLAEAWPEPPDDGRRRGVGYCTYVQLAGVGPSAENELIGLDIGGYETAVVRLERDGSVRVVTGVSPHGQGHETTFAQLVADRLGVEPARVQLRHSDTDETPYSAYGTAASRSMAVGGAAAVEAADRVAATVRTIAAEMLEANPDDIELAAGTAMVRGGGGSIALTAVAARAWQGFGLPSGVHPGLEARVVYDPASCTFSYGTHACRVALDRDTGAVEIEQYAVVQDCGTIVNPTIVEGQIHGGIAQGAGATLLEEVVHDDTGQCRTAAFTDYLVPGTTFLPAIDIEHVETPSPFTPGGMKGMGEGGTNGSFACVANAVAAALPEIGDRVVDTPLSPERLWRLVQARERFPKLPRNISDVGSRP
ncbi:MAG TPA: xanthine dehydrogenase family protein molybdopterin-binding subunit [Acidimicrobiales bacterium]|jgi:carbon-monoxide dehydrogenase large subunit|nr:xanthine dehydrogenase family protein molybdopterin-binding subunit [Acidimicrobiales bacterium]